MFSAPRFVAIDDKTAHLSAIQKTLETLGSPCLPILYDAAKAFDAAHFRGVRALFIDLHLLEGVAASDDKRHFAQMASILEDNISEHGGPFVLIVWTEHPQHQKDLVQYLENNLDPAKPYVRPLQVLCLAKQEFLDLASGAIKRPAALRTEVEETIKKIPQLAALLSWESDVLTAAGSTMGALLSLIPRAKKTSALFPAELDRILSLLAREAVGSDHVAQDPRAAIYAALAPLHADRVINQTVSADSAAAWKQAVTLAKDLQVKIRDAAEAGLLNRMLHVASTQAEEILATSWGAVVDFPREAWNDGCLRENFEFSIKELVEGELKIKPEKAASCVPCLIRIGAVCDHAQGKKGTIPYVFGMEIPLDARSNSFKATGAEWSSPVLTRSDGSTYLLIANARLVASMTSDGCIDFKVRYRLREQLLMQLITHASEYAARPGILKMPKP
ncbi:MAG: hypothetical protein ABL962_02635 [Fimbriimonadaceae bacterium]